MNAQAMTDILDIAGNVHSPWPDRIFMFCIFLALLLVLALVYWIARAARTRKLQIQKIAPEVLAEKRLRELAQNPPTSFAQAYFLLTEILKRYVTDGLHLDFADKTYEEMKILLPKLKPYLGNDKELEELLQLFARSEKIKFAKFAAEAKQFSQDVHFVRAFVEKSHAALLALKKTTHSEGSH